MAIVRCDMECAKCDSHLGSVLNSWTRHTPDHYSPQYRLKTTRPWIVSTAASPKLFSGPFQQSKWKTLQCKGCMELIGAMSFETDMETTLASDALVFLKASINLRPKSDPGHTVRLYVPSVAKSSVKPAAKVRVEEVLDEGPISQPRRPEPRNQRQLNRGPLTRDGRGNPIVRKPKQLNKWVRKLQEDNEIDELQADDIDVLQKDSAASGDVFDMLKAEISSLRKQMMQVREEQQKDYQKLQRSIESLKEELIASLRGCRAEFATTGQQVTQLGESHARQPPHLWPDEAAHEYATGEHTALARVADQQTQEANTRQLRRKRIRDDGDVDVTGDTQPPKRLALLLEATTRKETRQKKRQDRPKRVQQLALAERAAAEPMDGSADAASSEEDIYVLDCILDRRRKMFFYVRWAGCNIQTWVRRGDILDKGLVRDFEDGYAGLDAGVEVVAMRENTRGRRLYKVHWKNGWEKWPQWVDEEDLSPECRGRVGVEG